MLTGDKLETAKSISITTGLYNQDEDELFVLKDVKTSEEMSEELKRLLGKLMSRDQSHRSAAVDLEDDLQFVIYEAPFN